MNATPHPDDRRIKRIPLRMQITLVAEAEGCSVGYKADAVDFSTDGMRIRINTNLRGQAQQVSHPQQIVNRGRPGEHPFHGLTTAVANLAHQADGFHPAEDLFHSLALLLADGVRSKNSNEG